MKKVILAVLVALTFLFSGAAVAHTFHSSVYKEECFGELFKVWYKDGGSYKYYGRVWGEDVLIKLVARNPDFSGFAREIDLCDGHTIRQANYSKGSF